MRAATVRGTAYVWRQTKGVAGGRSAHTPRGCGRSWRRWAKASLTNEVITSNSDLWSLGDHAKDRVATNSTMSIVATFQTNGPIARRRHRGAHTLRAPRSAAAPHLLSALCVSESCADRRQYHHQNQQTLRRSRRGHRRYPLHLMPPSLTCPADLGSFDSILQGAGYKTATAR